MLWIAARVAGIDLRLVLKPEEQAISEPSLKPFAYSYVEALQQE
jgi:hypothetical protein